MAEARFIKTVAFGGYEKSEVIRRLEHLNSQVFDLKNELRETKLLLDAFRKGTDAEKANETVLSGERAKLTQVQVQNETLTTKLKATEEENRNYEQKVKELSDSVAELSDKLKAANDKIAGLQSGGEAAALSQVFIEAQKSADMLVNNAKAEAEKLASSAKTAAETTIADANDEAAQIIYEAERTAAVRIAESKNSAEEMNVSTNNMKALMLDDVTKLGAEMTQLRTLLEKFMETGLADISDAEERLFNVSTTLREGGVPVFKAPEYFEPQIPEQPKRTALTREDSIDPEEKQKKQNDLEKLKQMAESIGAKKNKTEEAPEKNEKSEQPAKQEEKKGGKIDLAALAAQASALNDKK
jgi:hypothetical protein